MRDEIFKVGRKYRTNELSFQHGGYEVIVEFENGYKFKYDNIHYPSNYIDAICDNNIEYGKVVSAYVDGEEYDYEDNKDYEEEDDYEYYEEKESYGQYTGTYAQDVEGLSDNFINDVLDGCPEAYWNID